MRFGVIGLQHFHVHDMIAGMMREPGVDVIAIAEPDDTAWERAGARYGLKRYRDYRQMLDAEHLDAVGIVNIPGDRAEVAAECLGRGLHVLCDKPAAVNWSGLNLLADAVREAGSAVLFPFFTVRYERPVVTLRELVTRGTLGKIASFVSMRPHKLMPQARPEWFWDRDRYGGVIVDLGIHDVDIYRWFLGDLAPQARSCSVSASHSLVGAGMVSSEATGERKEHAFSDVGHFMLVPSAPAACPTAVFRVDWLTPDAEPMHGDCRYFVVGTDGVAEVRTTGGLPGEGESLHLVTRTQPPRSIELKAAGTTIFADFADAARGVRPAAISADEFIEANAIVLMARDAADAADARDAANMARRDGIHRCNG